MRATPMVVLGLLLAGGCRKEASEPDLPAPAAQAPATARCVYFKQLRPFLPTALPGYRTARDEGSTGKYGAVSVSEAERVFRQGERELAVRIVDTSVAKELGARIKAAAEDASSRDANDPTAPMLLGESVGFVRYDPDEERAEANLLVAGRFVVAVTGRGFEGTREVRELARGLDLEGLAGVK